MWKYRGGRNIMSKSSLALKPNFVICLMGFLLISHSSYTFCNHSSKIFSYNFLIEIFENGSTWKSWSNCKCSPILGSWKMVTCKPFKTPSLLTRWLQSTFSFPAFYSSFRSCLLCWGVGRLHVPGTGTNIFSPSSDVRQGLLLYVTH
jgi:hypothetical protein